MSGQQYRQHDHIVFFHHPCLDGSAAAWCAYQKFGNTARYFGVDHGCYQTLDDLIVSQVLSHHTVYLIDFVPPLDLVKKLLGKAQKLIVLDHHYTSFMELQGFEAQNLSTHFDLERSGAGIAWDYFMEGQERPVFITLVEAIDLRKEDYFKDTNVFFDMAAYLDSLDISSFEQTLKLFGAMIKEDVASFTKQGSSFRYEALQRIEDVLKQTEYVSLNLGNERDLQKIPFVHGNIYDLGREFSSKLLEKCDGKNRVGIIWYEYKKNFIRFNIRTERGVSAIEIADTIKKRYGFNGGGHVHSAVVRMEKTQFDIFYSDNSEA